MHLTYRIFEIAKRIKINDELLSTQGMQQYDLDNDVEMKNEWKEVQLQISENGVMSVTNIAEAKVPENGASLLDVKPELDLSVVKNDDLPELSPIQKTEKLEKVEKIENLEMTELAVKKEESPESIVPISTATTVSTNPSTTATISTDLKLGKHKLPEETIDINPKIMKINPPVSKPSLTITSIKNVQQLSRNHPLKIHSQTTQPPKSNLNAPIVSNNILKTPKTTHQQNVQCFNNKNNVNNNHSSVKPVTFPQKDLITTPNNSVVQNSPNINTIILPTTKKQSSTTSARTLTSATNMTSPQGPKYTQAGQSTDNTKVTKSNDSAQLLVNNQKTPISSSCSILPTTANTIQSSKVGIVPKKTPAKPTMVYKTLRDPPKVWNPQIPRQNYGKNSLYSNNGASTSDQKRADAKPAKFFKMRNNMPRYLGNPASGVKPMYQVREGDKSPPDPKKQDIKINNNEIVKDLKHKPAESSAPPEPKAKIDLKKSIIKIDPKTLRPITDASPAVASCSDVANNQVMKINQSSVPIFNPLRTQKNQTSPKIERRSPKTSIASSSGCNTTNINFLDPPKSPLEQRNSPKSSTGGKNSPSPTSKKEKLNLSFTPPNPFIPNLSSPNIAPIFFSWFPSYNPAAALNNNFPPFHPLNMYNSEHMYPGRSAQDLASMPPNLMSNLNLEVHKNRRKFYDNPAILPLSPNMENNKKSATCVKDNKSAANTNEEKTNTASIVATSKSMIVKTAKLENKETIKNNSTNSSNSSSSISNKEETKIEKSSKTKTDNEASKREEKVDKSDTKSNLAISVENKDNDKNKTTQQVHTKPKEKEEQTKKEEIITKEVGHKKDSIVSGPPKTTAT